MPNSFLCGEFFHHPYRPKVSLVSRWRARLASSLHMQALRWRFRRLGPLVLPVPFDTSAWCSNKSVLTVGGAIDTRLDRDLASAAKVVRVNAATQTHEQVHQVDIMADAHALPMLDGESFDVVASSHTIEHLVNPLKALREWARVLKPGGFIYSVIPDYRFTFDRRRQVTTLRHLIDDFERGQVGVDWFHVEEYLKNHDAIADLVYKGDSDSTFDDVMREPQFHVHWHVFDRTLTYLIHSYLGYQCIACFDHGFSIYYVGQKPSGKVCAT